MTVSINLFVIFAEHFDDVGFTNTFLKLHSLLETQEDVIDTPISYSRCLKELVECVSKVQFTKLG